MNDMDLRQSFSVKRIDIKMMTIDEEDEECTFWIFAMLVESILPLDYYSNMVGVLID